MGFASRFMGTYYNNGGYDGALGQYDPYFTFDKYFLYFDQEAIPTSNEKEDLQFKSKYVTEKCRFSFAFLKQINPRKLEICTDRGHDTLILGNLENLLKIKSIRSIKFLNHPTPDNFLKKALSSSSRIESIRLEIQNSEGDCNYSDGKIDYDEKDEECEEDEEVEENDDNEDGEQVVENLPDNHIFKIILKSRNLNLRRLVIKDMEPIYFPHLFNSLIINKNHSSIKALGLLVFDRPNPIDVDLSPLLQLPNIDTLYCNSEELPLYLNHISINKNIKILKCYIGYEVLTPTDSQVISEFLNNLNNNSHLEKLVLILSVEDYDVPIDFYEPFKEYTGPINIILKPWNGYNEANIFSSYR
eukprot:gene7943-9772_t